MASLRIICLLLFLSFCLSLGGRPGSRKEGTSENSVTDDNFKTKLKHRDRLWIVRTRSGKSGENGQSDFEDNKGIGEDYKDIVKEDGDDIYLDYNTEEPSVNKTQPVKPKQ